MLPAQYASIVADFQRLRRRAALEALLSRMTGASPDLLSFEQVRQMLRATASNERRLMDIPLDAIVGSVGRYHDFTRSFLPRQDSDQSRWASVASAASGYAGLPPIEVYQIGDAYFVLDGNHRVSVARQNGANTIQAYVTPFRSRVSFDPHIKPDQLIIRAEQALFLEQTRLDETRPGSDLTLTEPGQYQVLREHIYVHGYYMELEQGAPVSFEDAAADWYDKVYMPVVRAIRDRGMLHDFPSRTETDLYLWLAEHRSELERQLGWVISTERAADDLAEQAGTSWSQVAQVGEHLVELSTPDRVDTTPTLLQRQNLPGQSNLWLFKDILVPVNGEEPGWEALDQAMTIARIEQSRLYGLHVVATQAQLSHPAALAVQVEFARRCESAGVQGQLALAVGNVAATIVERSRWVDLVVLKITYPPGAGPLDRLKSGLTGLIRTSIRPVLTVPRPTERLERILLAYDATPKSEEALAMAAYLAARWKIELKVLTVTEAGEIVERARMRARDYLGEYGVRAQFLYERGPAGAAIVDAAERNGCDLIVIGGYGRSMVGTLMLGSTAEEVLRTHRLPTLICQ